MLNKFFILFLINIVVKYMFEIEGIFFLDVIVIFIFVSW